MTIRGLWNKITKRGDYTQPKWWIQNFPGMISSDEIAITPMSSLGSATVYAATKMITGTLSSVPFNTYKRSDLGRELAVKHDQYYLLKHEPYKLYTSSQFRSTLGMHYLSWGNG